MGRLNERWDLRFSELASFHARFGHCRVALGWTENPSLAVWVNVQRVRQARGMLRPDRRARLSTLGFEFEVREPEWEEYLAQFRAFRIRFGHGQVPRFWKENRALGSWVDGQRRAWREGTLPPDRRVRLQAAGFVSDPNQAKWDAKIASLVAYRERCGDANVPQFFREDRALGNWMTTQRTLYRRGRLAPERFEQLREIGVDFGYTNVAARWTSRLAELVAFHRRHGHSRIPKGHPLSAWALRVRLLHGRGELNAEGVRQLRALDFDLADPWEAGFARLVAFKAVHGHCEGFRLQDPKLSSWVSRQRRRKAMGRLPPGHVARLEALGFPWAGRPAPPEDPWISRLQQFRKRHQHLEVTSMAVTDGPLAQWARQQQRDFERGTLGADLTRELRAAGLPLAAEERHWERRFAGVSAWKHRNPNRRPPPNSALGTWLAEQVRLAQAGELATDREQRLDDLYPL